MWNIFKRLPSKSERTFVPLSMEEPKPPELTFEEKREMMIKINIGNPIILWKAKTLETIVTRDPVFDYTNDAANTCYVSHYEDHKHTNITSAETIEGILSNVTQKMICVDNKWYTFGYEPEKYMNINLYQKLINILKMRRLGE